MHKNIAGAPKPSRPKDQPKTPDPDSSNSISFGRASIIEFVHLPKVEAPPLAQTDCDYRRWTELERLEVGQSHLSHLDLSADGRYILTVSESEAAARIYALETKELLFTAPIPAYEPYGRGDFLFWPRQTENELPPITVSTSDSIAILDPASKETRSLFEGRGAWQMRWSDDGGVLMAALADIATQTSTLRFFQVCEGGACLEPILSLRFDERVDGFDLSPNGSRLAVSYYPSDSVEMLDLRDRRLLWRSSGPKFAGSIDISPDGLLVALGGQHLKLYDAETGQKLGVFEKLQNNIHEVVFSPSAKALAVTAYDGRVRILSTRFKGPTLPKLKVLRHNRMANVYEAVFTADESRLLTCSGDGTIRIWGSLN